MSLDWIFRKKVFAQDGTPREAHFGTAVSVYGNFALIGAPNQGFATGTPKGSAYIFQRQGADWQQIKIIILPSGKAHDQCGFAVSLFSDYVLIGASLSASTDLNRGGGYIFQRQGSDWVFIKQLMLFSDALPA